MSIWMEVTDGIFAEFIQIPFTRNEWECIKGSLELTIHDRCIGNEGKMERNIIDRIEKNLGIE